VLSARSVGVWSKIAILVAFSLRVVP
jgi:hypothetical protein